MKKISAEKLKLIITWIVRALLIGAIVVAIILKRYEDIFIAVFAIFGTFLPNIIEKKMKVYLPIPLQIIIVIFIYLAEGLGEIADFYYTVPWWDNMLHMTSGGILGIIGLMFVYLLNKNHVREINLSPFFIVLFAFCFALMIGVVWEIYEFAMDRVFDTNMQKFRFAGEDGLVDTMTDLIVDTIGAFVVTASSYLIIKVKSKISKEAAMEKVK